MKTLVFYFQVHQPYRMRNYHILEIGKSHNYFDDVQNNAIIKKVAEKCYLPANKAIANLIRRTQGKFRVSYSVSGVALEQMQKETPEVIDTFRDLASTGGVEFLARLITTRSRPSSPNASFRSRSGARWTPSRGCSAIPPGPSATPS